MRFVQDNLRSADDMITITSLALPSTLPPDRFVEWFRLAIMHLRFHHPILAVSICTGLLPNLLIPALMYEPGTIADLDAWAAQFVQVHTPQDETMPMADRVEQLRRTLGLTVLDVEQCAKRVHLVLPGRPDEANVVAVLVHTAHSISDAHTELVMMRRALELAGEYASAPYPLPRNHPLHPATLPWGTEHKNLIPCMHDLVGVPIDSYNREDGISEALRVLSGYSLLIKPAHTPTHYALCETKRANFVLSVADTARLRVAAKAHGLTMTQIVDASRYIAMMETNRTYLESGAPRKETLHVNFLLPYNIRPLVQNFSGDLLGCLSSGFTTVMPLNMPYFVPATQEKNKPLHELDQVRSLVRVASNLAKQYHERRNRIHAQLRAQMPLLLMGGMLGPYYPKLASAPEGFSSVGVVDALLPAEIPTPGGDPTRVTDWRLGMLMSDHEASLHFSMHIWTRVNQLHVSVMHTEDYADALVQGYLDVMRETLLLFAQAYEESHQLIEPSPMRELPAPKVVEQTTELSEADTNGNVKT